MENHQKTTKKALQLCGLAGRMPSSWRGIKYRYSCWGPRTADDEARGHPQGPRLHPNLQRRRRRHHQVNSLSRRSGGEPSRIVPDCGQRDQSSNRCLHNFATNAPALTDTNTNGKVERFNRTQQEKWAYAKAYTSGTERESCYPEYIDYYNQRGPHSALRGTAPISRVINQPGYYN